MTNHPNRATRPSSRNPAPTEIRALRDAAGLTQGAAAALIYCSQRGWQDWELGKRRMHPAFWELFQRKLARAQKNRSSK